MEFRLYGPVEVRDGGRPVPVGGPRQRAVLAALLLHRNETVGTDRLLRLVWEDPPDSAGSNLRTYLARLRRVLGDRLSAGGDGHRLAVGDGELDVDAFTALAAEAERAEDPALAAERYAEALGHVRGEPLSGLEPTGGLRAAALELAARRDAAVRAELRAGLDAGRHHEAVGRIRALLTARPADEELIELLMRALFRCGRQAEALDAYAELRATGVRPGRSLSDTHRRILAQDPELLPCGDATARAYDRLPPCPDGFTGRDAQLAEIREAARGAGPAPAIAVLSGMAGVGKTGLAVRAAHDLLADGYGADGRLYVDLGGFTPGAAPAGPHTVLASFLELLGVPANRVPADADERLALYRERTAGLRLIVLLDNALTAEQVRPLIPGGPGTVVLVTSRRTLVLDGAADLPVPLFTDPEALALLTGVLGNDRVRADLRSARALADHCGRLPLAVALLAHRLRSSPRRPLADLVARLDATGDALGEIDPERAAERAFAVSYAYLDPARRRLFRLLGLPPCEDFTVPAAAALCGRDAAEVDRELEGLLDDHLLVQTRPGRYRMHDLVRGYAAARSVREDPAEERRAAVDRLYDWYLRTAEHTVTADAHADPLPSEPPPLVTVPAFADAAEAGEWFHDEYANLHALVRTATGERRAYALALTQRLHGCLTRYRNPYDITEWFGYAERAAESLGDLTGQAFAVLQAGRVTAALRGFAAAESTLDRALALARAAGHRPIEADVLRAFGTVHQNHGDHTRAYEWQRASVDLARELGDRRREAVALGNVGISLHLVGRHDEALDHLKRALAIQQELGEVPASTYTNLSNMLGRLERYEEALVYADLALGAHRHLASHRGEAMTLANRSESLLHLGRLAEAVEDAEAALRIARSAGTIDVAAIALNSIGEVRRRTGHADAAIRAHEEALELAVRASFRDEVERARTGLGLARAERDGR